MENAFLQICSSLGNVFFFCFRYEGTGRSLSLKLLGHLEMKSQNPAFAANSSHSGKI